MIRATIAMVLLLALQCHGQSDIFFTPCEPEASVSFDGETQSGKSMHRLEVRRLAYGVSQANNQRLTPYSCVIYFAGENDGPQILRHMVAIDPLVRRASKDLVEIYYLAGANIHVRQRWKLVGHTAELIAEEQIDWRNDPRMKEEPSRQTNQPRAVKN